MIQTIVYLSITTVVFMVLFIVTYVKYRKLEYDFFYFVIGKEYEEVDKKMEHLKRELEKAENISFQNEMKDILGES